MRKRKLWRCQQAHLLIPHFLCIHTCRAQFIVYFVFLSRRITPGDQRADLGAGCGRQVADTAGNAGLWQQRWAGAQGSHSTRSGLRGSGGIAKQGTAGMLLSPWSALRCWNSGFPVASVSTRRLLFIPKQKGEPLNKKTTRALIKTAGGVVKMPLIPETRFRQAFCMSEVVW